MTEIIRFPVRKAAPLRCVWMETGNPTHPLACKWVEQEEGRLVEEIPSEPELWRLCA